MIQTRRHAEKKEERYDRFSSLLEAANDDSDGEPKLADSELAGMLVIRNRYQRLTVYR